MKWFFVWVFTFITVLSRSQDSVICADLQVCERVTVHLIFPYAIITGDCGSTDVAAQRVAQADNVLQVKAVKPGFASTNLSVITAGGALYCFVLHYDANPAQLVVNVSPTSAAQAVQVQANLREADSVVLGLLDKPAAGPMRRVHGKEVRLSLHDIIQSKGLSYFHFRLRSRSRPTFSSVNPEVSLQDLRQVNRTPSQQIPVIPLMTTVKTLGQGRKSELGIVVVTPLTPIRKGQCIAFRFAERDGIRVLRLRVKQSDFLKAQVL